MAMVADGLSEKEACARFWIIDKDGLLDSQRRDLSDEQTRYARHAEELLNWPRNPQGQIGLAEVIARIDVTVLIGLSTVRGIFSEAIVREMAKKVERPIIFPLSNPTSHSEAEPADLIRWTDGRALVATGSPFAPVTHDGKTFEIAQCNNVFIFPAVGLGLAASKAWRVTDQMLLAGAKALGACSPAMRDPTASLLPTIKSLRDVARDIALAVPLEAEKQGLGPTCDPEAMRKGIERTQWTPEYVPYRA
jgi:malate dehydrogenase (oxaloacetate-decarboxylating)